MKKVLSLLILLFLLISLSGCLDQFKLRKPSLILKYYENSHQWAGIILGRSNKDETIMRLHNIVEVEEDTIHKIQGFRSSDYAICTEFTNGFRERDLCIWFADDKAQVMEFSGGRLTLDEIQTQLGELKKFAVYTYRGPSLVINYDGFSIESGYIIEGGRDIKGSEKDIQNDVIDKKTIFFIYLIHPDFFDDYYHEGSDYWNYFFEEGGFQDWHGYGEYEVQRPAFLN